MDLLSSELRESMGITEDNIDEVLHMKKAKKKPKKVVKKRKLTKKEKKTLELEKKHAAKKMRQQLFERVEAMRLPSGATQLLQSSRNLSRKRLQSQPKKKRKPKADVGEEIMEDIEDELLIDVPFLEREKADSILVPPLDYPNYQHVSKVKKKTSKKKHDGPQLPSYAHVHVERSENINKARECLPIMAEEAHIVDIVTNHLVTIICGSTGSGKSSQVPQFLFENGFGRQGRIACTQPRRIAAVSVASRVRYEMGSCGSVVGHHVRYDASVNDSTSVCYMTDGILLKQMESDFLLKNYSVIILDEAHERTMHTDILIGLLSRVIPLRYQMFKNGEYIDDRAVLPLRLIIMSATLRVEEFAENKRLFPEAPPVIEVAGRQFDVTVHWSRVTPTLDTYLEVAFRKICKIHQTLPFGGLLVFLPGKREIQGLRSRLSETFTEYLEGAESGDWNEARGVRLCMLYSGVEQSEHQKVFGEPISGFRTIVLSTNVAETSLTIPHVRYILDTGLCRFRQWSGDGHSTFRVGYISKASAEQRKGRAGRVMEGHCYRLFSSAFYDQQMVDWDAPDVLQQPLPSLVLAMLSMGISNPLGFPFPTPPALESIVDAEKTLEQLGLIDPKRALTPLGVSASRLPIHPRYARAILACDDECRVLCVCACAILAVGELRTGGPPVIAQKDENAWGAESAECIGLIAHLQMCESPLFVKYCKERSLRFQAVQEARNLAQQICNILDIGSDLKSILKVVPLPKAVISVLRALASGLLMHLARRVEGDSSYISLIDQRQCKLHQHVIRSFREARHRWIMYATLLESEKSRKAHIIMPIMTNPSWLLDINPSPSLVNCDRAVKPYVVEWDDASDCVKVQVRPTFGPHAESLPLQWILLSDRDDVVSVAHFCRLFLLGHVFEQMLPVSSLLLVHPDCLLSSEGPAWTRELPRLLRSRGAASKEALLRVWTGEPHFAMAQVAQWLVPAARPALQRIFHHIIKSIQT